MEPSKAKPFQITFDTIEINRSNGFAAYAIVLLGLFSFHSKVDVKTSIQGRDERRSKVSAKY